MSAEIFVSYAEEDQALCDDLLKQLAPLGAEIFTRGRITAGAEWSQEIFTALEQARVVLLLVSADFYASEFSRSEEMRRAVERHDDGSAVVVPVILRPCMWKGMPFSKLQALPSGAKPVTGWPDRDEALLDVAQGVGEVLERLRREARSVPPQATASGRVAADNGVSGAPRFPAARPPPYKMIAGALAVGEAVVFLGAGASVNGESWTRGSGGLPRRPELARHLLARNELDAEAHVEILGALPWVSHCLEAVSGRHSLEAELHAIHTEADEPGELYRLLAGLPRLLVVTLGWDRLLERALVERGRNVHRLVYQAGDSVVRVWAPGASEAEEVAPNVVDLELGDDPVIFQVCGVAELDLERRSPLVATERDLVELLRHLPSALPAPLALPFRERQHLVLGFDLSSWAERMVLDQIWQTWERKSTAAAWAVHDAMLPLEREHWTLAHRLRVFEMPLEGFVARLVEESGNV